MQSFDQNKVKETTMANLAETTEYPCWAEFQCAYKVGDSCNFRQQVKALLSVLQEKHHKGSNCIIDLFDIFREPCLEQDEEEHNSRVTDILGL